MTSAPVVRSELADGIANQIRDAILAGEYAPGDVLPSERDLTRRLGANRTTVREGLAQLEHQGLIERRQGARCRVLDYRRTGSIELLPDLVRLSRNRRSRTEPSALASTNEVLLIIYEGALDLAFERITAAEIAQLDKLANDVEVAAAAGDVSTVQLANRSFHQGVARATHSIALELLVGSFYRVVDSAAARSSDKSGAVATALIELHDRGVRLPHRALADAIAAGNPAEARSVVRRMLGQERSERPMRLEDAMTTDTRPELPDRDEVDATIKRVENQADTIYAWNYARERDQLVTLYNKGVSSQWSSITDLDWATDVDPEELVRQQDSPTDSLVRTAAELPGSPLAKWGEAEFTALSIEMFKASLSQFMHGEQGAMLTAAKLVEAVPWIDAKYYAATQTMDEARHTEVFAKYLDTKLGEAYPMSPFLEQQIDALLQDSRWDIAYLGMQIVIESLALAAFGDMLRRIQEPLLRKLLRYVMSDEARHVAFGVLSLQELYQGLTEAELKDRQEFLVENTLRSRARSTTPEVWERMGVDVDEVRPFLFEAAAKLNRGNYMGFQRAFFAKLVPNVRKLGLLDANDGYLRNAWGEAGLMEFEFADDTGTDYTSYDEVAADRAGSRT